MPVFAQPIDLKAAAALDKRSVVATIAERDALLVYEGLETWVTGTQKKYRYTNGAWAEVGEGGSGSGGSSVTVAAQASDANLVDVTVDGVKTEGLVKKGYVDGAVEAKQDKITSPIIKLNNTDVSLGDTVKLKTIGGKSIVGEGDISIEEFSSGIDFITTKVFEQINVLATHDSTNDPTSNKIEFFIYKLKIENLDGVNANSIAIESIIEDSGYLDINIRNLDIANAWILYQPHIEIKDSGIYEYRLIYGRNIVYIALNWDYKVTTRTRRIISNNVYKLGINDSKLNTIPDTYKIYNRLEGRCDDGTLFQKKDVNSTTLGNCVTQDTDGIKIVHEGLNKSASVLFNNVASIKSGDHKYAMYFDYTIRDRVVKDNRDILSFNLFKNGQSPISFDSTTIDLGSVFVSGASQRKQFVAIGSFNPSYNTDLFDLKLRISSYNNTATTDKIMDITFHSIQFIELPDDRDFTNLEVIDLVRHIGHVTTNSLSSTCDNDKNGFSLYGGLKLKSLGDSLPETVSFQPYIAHAMGMAYDAKEELRTEQITFEDEIVTKWRSVWGTTKVQPIITSHTNERLNAGASIYMRAKSLKYTRPDVLIILAGANDVPAGTQYVSGGSASQPDDFGINDAPYIGDEIDLVDNPTAEVPSFGACYRGMIENILTDLPYLRIIICGIVRGLSDTSVIGMNNDWIGKKNEVIKKIAYEYGLPYVDLAANYGVNKFNSGWLTKDGLHFSDFGGRRVAMEIIAHAF